MLATALVVTTGHSAYWGIVAATSFGRVYFWAHHVLDVVAGAALGIVVTFGMEKLVGDWRHFTLWHVACAWVFMIACYVRVYRNPQANVARVISVSG